MADVEGSLTRILNVKAPRCLPRLSASLRSYGMFSASAVLMHVQQLASYPDTVVARVVPVRGVFEWAGGLLQIFVLLLGVAALVTLVLLLLTIRTGVAKLNDAVEKFIVETRPLIANANHVVGDAQAVVARVRHDVERVTDAASEISDRLFDAADTTTQRVDDVNAVLDVIQAELEDVAISTVSAIRGASVGARALGAVFGHRSRRARDVSRDARPNAPAVRSRRPPREDTDSA